MNTGNLLLIVIGAILLVAIVLSLGVGMAMGGMAMMAGRMGNPVDHPGFGRLSYLRGILCPLI